MTFAEYQMTVLPLAIYPREEAIVYPVLGLVGEAGEVVEKVKKHIRRGEFDRSKPYGGLDPQQRVELIKELGDVLWYVQAVAADLGYTLDQVARHNATKLTERKLRGTLEGSGDNR